MVFLSEIAKGFPFNKNAEPDYSDKEIYTMQVPYDDMPSEWIVNIPEPMEGFVYIGMRMTIYGKVQENYTAESTLKAPGNRRVFGPIWNNVRLYNGEWHPFGFPLTRRIVSVDEDGFDLVIKHDQPRMGKMELIAQRYDDFLEDERGITYAFVDDVTNAVEWVLTHNGRFYKPDQRLDDPNLIGKIKLLPCLNRLLDPNAKPWIYNQKYLEKIHLFKPLHWLHWN
jgi:hypothetical protein